MRKVTVVAAALFLVLALAIPAFCAELKIGYVDALKIFNDYEKTKDYDGILAEKQKVKEAENEKKVAEIKKLQDQFALLKDTEKEKKKSEMESKLKEFEDFRNKAVMDLRKQQADYMKEIADEIDAIVKDEAKKGGYDYILSGQSVIYGKDAFDLTASVLKKLNDSYKATSSKK